MKYALMGFVALSLCVAIYKAASAPGKPQAAPAGTAAVQPVAVKPAAPPVVVKKITEKTAVVYYFYTNTRCSSCKTIEAYTREAVEKNFSAPYKGWDVVFKGVNLDEQPNAHFKQDYWLNSKSVVVQKFSGDKALKWGKLEEVWQLLGDKDAFLNYVTAGTRKLLDEK